MSPSIRWYRLPVAVELPAARDWLEKQAESDLSPTTVDAYSRAVERYLVRCQELRLNPHSITTAQVANYFRELQSAGLGVAAIRQRYVAIRLFHACVVERQERPDNPLEHGLPAREVIQAKGWPVAPPGVPSEVEWSKVLAAAAREPLRTRLMLAVAYVGALRREDICRIEVTRAELRRGRLRLLRSSGPVRVIVIPANLAAGIDEYLGGRRSPALLFTSESRRNANEPITVWTWAKVTRRIAMESQVPGFTPAAVRHLRLTDLARTGRDARDIAAFAGYRSPRLAYRYIQVARRHALADVDHRREQQFEQLFGGRPR